MRKKVTNQTSTTRRIEIEMPCILAGALEKIAAKTPGGMDAVSQEIWAMAASRLKN